MDYDIRFTDRVMNVGDVGEYVSVMFRTQAAGYTLLYDNDDFDEILAALQKSMETKKPVSVVVHGTEIVSVSAQ